MDLKDISRKDIACYKGLTAENIQLGSLQRIALSLELIATQNAELLKDRKLLQDRLAQSRQNEKDLYDRWQTAKRKLSVCKGHQTRLRNKLKSYE